MKRLAVTLAVLAVPATAAARPATPAEAYTVAIARTHLQRLGVPVPPGVGVAVMETPLECGGWPAHACADPETHEVVLSPEVAAASACVSAAFHKAGRWLRSLAFQDCGDAGGDALATALHEVVHVARFNIVPQSAWVGSWEEGLATAVSLDQLIPLQARFLGPRLWVYDGYQAFIGDDQYRGWTDAVRTASATAVGAVWTSPAARRWRLNQIGATP